jgi:hypothetical protein
MALFKTHGRMESAGCPSPKSSPLPMKNTWIGTTDLEKILLMERRHCIRQRMQLRTSAKHHQLTIHISGRCLDTALWTCLEEVDTLALRTKALCFLKSYAKVGTISIVVGTMDRKM